MEVLMSWQNDLRKNKKRLKEEETLATREKEQKDNFEIETVMKLWKKFLATNSALDPDIQLPVKKKRIYPDWYGKGETPVPVEMECIGEKYYLCLCLQPTDGRVPSYRIIFAPYGKFSSEKPKGYAAVLGISPSNNGYEVRTPDYYSISPLFELTDVAEINRFVEIVIKNLCIIQINESVSLLDGFEVKKEFDLYTEKTKKNRCYIATAIYGSYLSTEVLILMMFREKLLQNSIYGKRLVALYYFVSPSIAKIVSKNDFIKKLLKRFFDIFASIIKKNIYRK
jgi:hypothetical protein